jgi:diketogulonate reductase-like aldo/keto reductase
VTQRLSDATYAIIDELHAIAKQQDTTPSRVAIAWVMARPGVGSTIIGARTLQQLDDNIGAADVKLSAEQLGKLDALSKPQLAFPANMAGMEATIMNGGTSVNGTYAPPWQNTPANDDERY